MYQGQEHRQEHVYMLQTINILFKLNNFLKINLKIGKFEMDQF